MPPVPHTRGQDQAVEAFSLPKDLLKTAKQRAAEKGMTKSGYFRYCLGLEMGMTEEQARALALHGSIRKLREAMEDSPVAPPENPAGKPSAASLLPDPKLTPKLKAIADDLEASEAKQAKRRHK